MRYLPRNTTAAVLATALLCAGLTVGTVAAASPAGEGTLEVATPPPGGRPKPKPSPSPTTSPSPQPRQPTTTTTDSPTPSFWFYCWPSCSMGFYWILDATLTSDGVGLADKTVVFRATDGSHTCSRRTGAGGRARCSPWPSYTSSWLRPPQYVVEFAGDETHEPSSATWPPDV